MFGINSNKTQLTEVRRVLSKTSGGIYKRIDENRELLELLVKEAPELIQRYPWVVNWIKSTDDFLTSMVAVSEMTVSDMSHCKQLPRSWPDLPPGGCALDRHLYKTKAL